MTHRPIEAAIVREFFPPLALSAWRETRDAIHGYARLLGAIRAALAPRQKHWWHITLHVAATGLTTTPIARVDKTFELMLDLTQHRLSLATSHGERWQTPLRGQSSSNLADETLAALAHVGVEIDIDRAMLGDAAGAYDREAVARFWQALSQIDGVMKKFKSALREETSPVQLFPHHFDLAMNWFTGRLIPGIDPADEESADEQMNFGFSTGDEGHSDPYFYITAYEEPAGLRDTPLPVGAAWITDAFEGAIMPYEALCASARPHDRLLEFFATVRNAEARLLQAR